MAQRTASSSDVNFSSLNDAATEAKKLESIKALVTQLNYSELLELVSFCVDKLKGDGSGLINVAIFVDALSEDHPGSLPNLFASSSLNVDRLKRIRKGDEPTKVEINAIALWAASLTDQTAEEIGQLFNKKATPR